MCLCLYASDVTEVYSSFPTRRSSDLERVVEHIPVPRCAALRLDDFLRRQRAGQSGDGEQRDRGWQFVADDLRDRKSTRLNSSHPSSSYAVFCLKKKTVIYRSTYIEL